MASVARRVPLGALAVRRRLAADDVARLTLALGAAGGLVGLGLIMVGVTVVNVSAKRRDSQLRQQQTELLADALRELRSALDQR
jgi:hypothetical protein